MAMGDEETNSSPKKRPLQGNADLRHTALDRPLILSDTRQWNGKSKSVWLKRHEVVGAETEDKEPLGA